MPKNISVNTVIRVFLVDVPAHVDEGDAVLLQDAVEQRREIEVVVRERNRNERCEDAGKRDFPGGLFCFFLGFFNL